MALRETQGSNIRTASIALVFGGAMWGLYWIPVRYFVDQGLDGAWPGIVMYTSALIVMVPILWRQRLMVFHDWRGLMFSGAFTGAAFSLFTISLVYTDVVRSILLFYLTPVWGTILGLIFLGERLDAVRLLGLLFGLGGMIIVLGNDQSMPWPRNTGDWLALISGMTWALGTLGLYRASGISVSGQVFAFISGALILSLISLPFGSGLAVALLERDALQSILLVALISAFYTLPMIYLTIWPATRLTPARVGLLLMSEVVVGLISAALLSGEPFGLRELVGAGLIVSAAFLEIARG
ncbi:MAG: DMT family transporter [Pseudomonadota bacterium]